MSVKKIRNMAEFAKVVGVSRPTVSKYFNDPSSVRQTTRTRLEKGIEEHDFRPNFYAMNITRRLTKNVGIVVPYLADPYFVEMACNLENMVRTAGFSPILLNSNGSAEQEQNNLDSLRSIRPAGVLFAPLGRISDHALLEEFCAAVPTVLFDSNIDRVGRAFIGSDHAQFASDMVEYLCRAGEPPSLFEMKTPANPNANRRHRGYVETMERLGFEPHVLQVDGTGWDFEEIGMRGGLRILEENALERRTILCSNDRLAIGFLAACHEKGHNIGRNGPSDLRIAGMDDHPYSRFTWPTLTTIAQDYLSVARQAVETLLDLIDDEETTDTRRTEILFEGKLIMRGSA